MRFIERISRPSTKADREKLFDEYHAKFQKLHNLLDDIKKYYTSKTYQKKDLSKSSNDKGELNKIK